MPKWMHILPTQRFESSAGGGEQNVLGKTNLKLLDLNADYKRRWMLESLEM